jgi:hypothetical protein
MELYPHSPVCLSDVYRENLIYFTLNVSRLMESYVNNWYSLKPITLVITNSLPYTGTYMRYACDNIYSVQHEEQYYNRPPRRMAMALSTFEMSKLLQLE